MPERIIPALANETQRTPHYARSTGVIHRRSRADEATGQRNITKSFNWVQRGARHEPRFVNFLTAPTGANILQTFRLVYRLQTSANIFLRVIERR
jgi:hypothetical protein